MHYLEEVSSSTPLCCICIHEACNICYLELTSIFLFFSARSVRLDLTLVQYDQPACNTEGLTIVDHEGVCQQFVSAGHKQTPLPFLFLLSLSDFLLMPKALLRQTHSSLNFLVAHLRFPQCSCMQE